MAGECAQYSTTAGERGADRRAGAPSATPGVGVAATAAAAGVGSPRAICRAALEFCGKGSVGDGGEKRARTV